MDISFNYLISHLLMGIRLFPDLCSHSTVISVLELYVFMLFFFFLVGWTPKKVLFFFFILKIKDTCFKKKDTCF